MKRSSYDTRNFPDRLASSRISILGLGLMGGSLALALHGRCSQLLGYDPDARIVRLAQARQVVEYASTQIDEIVPQADLLILAAPVKQILLLLAELDRLHAEPAVVLDVGSTKRQVLAAMQVLPARFDPLGGHPICGKEQSSLSNAEAGLYQGAPFVLCRLSRTSGEAIALVCRLIQTIGAHPIWMEAGAHDQWVASTSHLPYLIANALVWATPIEAAALAGPGFRSTTRLAGSFAPMLLDVLETNRDLILPALQLYRDRLDRLESSLKSGDWAGIEFFLKENAQKKVTLLAPQSTDNLPGGQPG